MPMREFLAALRDATGALEAVSVRDELAPILPHDELVGLVPRIRAAVIKVLEELERNDASK